jgi:di/tricarboxylate transporter
LHRPTLGILAIVLLSLAAALTFFSPAEGQYAQYTSACMRVGVVLAVLWLALPDTKPLKNRLLIAGIVLAAVVFVVRPRLLLVAIKHPLVVGLVGAALFLLKILRPRRSRTDARSGRKGAPAREPKKD